LEVSILSYVNCQIFEWFWNAFEIKEITTCWRLLKLLTHSCNHIIFWMSPTYILHYILGSSREISLHVNLGTKSQNQNNVTSLHVFPPEIEKRRSHENLIFRESDSRHRQSDTFNLLINNVEEQKEEIKEESKVSRPTRFIK